MWRNIASNGLTMLILAFAGIAGLIAWGQNRFIAPGPLAEAICVRVAPGSSMAALSEDLETRGAVTNGWIFRVGADYTERSSKLKAGSFLIPEQASMDEIVTAVTRGGASTCGTEIVYRIGVAKAEIQIREMDPTTGRFSADTKFVPGEGEVPKEYTDLVSQSDTRFRVSTAPGATSWQIVDSLKKADFLSGEISEIPPEGLLAPDSYEIRAGADRAALLAKMQDAQEKRLADAWERRADDLPYDTAEEALIMASIIEKETGVPDERSLVASVFINRLRQGMKLQTDPTVIYGVTKGEGILGRGLRRSELREKTPYNTYVIDGLPPTPIANPGRDAIEAAVNPGESDFVFFVADGTGGHAFAKTLSEHNANVQKWRKLEADRAAEPAEPAAQ
ncbi:branched-chain alpha-keto acid dehydrogenase subunit E2 [Brevirhabdus pacifica]|uniref:Endolytic murein transglycosylase n=1 Tax=Brevirhabdus pacifica TaxID=1267768 RepID=A0A1U7DEE1_9RHOB|nr:endolytic transglycosylase MltG [Brevirhabdus pacifica]APX88367.1 branched-chain alpha-keto acid dehydrogenase subunit E2 [Brevirhabdus pacifica]OWU79687.1 branched-chain alpha-keto acid dehydrogenase subunit E2 [Loktanella sp. 22II-4b]PJJ87178.1 UPF0755 protein [Brevirhabdus pacifica]